SDAAFRAWREDGAVRDPGTVLVGSRLSTWRGTAGQHRRVRTRVQQTPRCCSAPVPSRDRLIHLKQQQKPINDDKAVYLDARHLEVFSMVGKPLPTGFEQGVHIRVVQEVLGHTRVTTTERYTHVATLQMKDAGERMDQALWGRG